MTCSILISLPDTSNQNQTKKPKMIRVPETKEEISLPWLQSIFSKQPFTVVGYQWSGQVGEGIGMMSSLERLTLQIQRRDANNNVEESKLNLIVKTLPSAPTGLRHFVINEGFCQRELEMYTKVLPAWEEFQREQNTPAHLRFRHPTCYYAAEEGEGLDYKMILILEDMKSSGFAAWEQGFKEAMGWTEAKQVVKELALFHAVGMAYKASQGLDNYDQKYDFLYTHSKDQELVDGLLKDGIQSTCHMLEAQGEVPQGLVKDLKAFQHVRELQKRSVPRAGRAGTVCHNDLHVNNVMVNQIDPLRGELPGAAILDFQGCTYGNPMTDLSFFLLLSCNESLFTTDLDSVLAFYEKTFNNAIVAMGMEHMVKYPLEEISEDYHRSLFVTIVHIILGSSSWCFGPCTNEQTVRRYKVALLDSFTRCNNSLGLHLLDSEQTRALKIEGTASKVATTTSSVSMPTAAANQLHKDRQPQPVAILLESRTRNLNRQPAFQQLQPMFSTASHNQFTDRQPQPQPAF